MYINGIDIFVTEHLMENSKANLIIVHGIAEHSGRYKHVVKYFYDNGFNVITYDLRGHGKSGGKRGYVKSFHDHIDDLHEVVKHVKTLNNQKVFLIGHSMGGAIVHMYEAKYHDVDGIISSAAASNTPKSSRVLKYIGFWYIGFVKISSKMFADHLSYDPYVKEDNLSDPLNLKFMYIKLIGEVMVKGAKYIQKNLTSFKTPILYIHGKDDHIVEPVISEKTFLKNKSLDKILLTYDHAKHELFNEYIKEEVFEDCKEWIVERL